MDYRKLEKQLQEQLQKKELSGFERKLFTGADVQKEVEQALESFSKKKGGELDVKARETLSRMEARAKSTILSLEKKIASAVANIPVPENGETPTEEELVAIITPLVEQAYNAFERKLKSITENSEVPQDLAGFESILKEAIKKYAPRNVGGGSVPTSFMELTDAPKGKKLQSAYAGQAGKAVVVRADEKGLEFSHSSGGDMEKSVYDPVGGEKQVAFKDDLADVATSGDYDDLDNKPVFGDLALKDKVEVADIDATGTPSDTTYLAGDGTWKTPPGGGSGIETVQAGSGIDVDAIDAANPRVGLDSATQDSLNKAESAVQPSDLGTLASKDDAPEDGKQYARQDGEWEEVESSSGGLEAVVDDPAPQLGGDLDANGHDIILGDNNTLWFNTEKTQGLSYDADNIGWGINFVGEGESGTSGGTIITAPGRFEIDAYVGADGDGNWSPAFVMESDGFLFMAPEGSYFTVRKSMSTVFEGSVSVGARFVAPDPSSTLDLQSNTKGFLPPRMTEAQRDAIASPATGLIVYNADTNALNLYDGTAWVGVGGGTPTLDEVLAAGDAAADKAIHLTTAGPDRDSASFTRAGFLFRKTFSGGSVATQYLRDIIVRRENDIDYATIKLPDASGTLLLDAPEDGKQYARKDGDWTEVGSGGVSYGSARQLPFMNATGDGFDYSRLSFRTFNDFGTKIHYLSVGAIEEETPEQGILRLYSGPDGAYGPASIFFHRDGHTSMLRPGALTGAHALTLPDASGTIALVEDIITSVVHNNDGNTERPAGYKTVIWYGAAEPLNKLPTDQWINENVTV